MLVLGILMAIAIPLIGGVREAANNAKCRSNLKQLHTAIIAFSTSNEERLPNLQSNLESLTDGGYIESESKLGICPGAGAKPKLPISSYAGGPDLDGTKTLSSEGINSETIVLEDADISYHKAGKNVIRLDGSFTQEGGIRKQVLTEKQQKEKDRELFVAVKADDLDGVKRLLQDGADVNARDLSGRTPLIYASRWGFKTIVDELLKQSEVKVDLSAGRQHALHITLARLHEVVFFINPGVPGNQPDLVYIARELIDAESDLTLTNSLNRTPLVVAKNIKNEWDDDPDFEAEYPAVNALIQYIEEEAGK